MLLAASDEAMDTTVMDLTIGAVGRGFKPFLNGTNAYDFHN